MEKLRRATEQGADHNAGSVDSIVAPRNPCPRAPACRSITPCPYTDAAACNYCGQHLDRADLLELYFGIRA